MLNIFKKNTTDSILSTFNTTINKLLTHQEKQHALADKKSAEARAAGDTALAARTEALRAGAVAAKFAKLVDTEAK